MKHMVPISPEMDAEIFQRFVALISPIVERSQGRTTLEMLVEDHKRGNIQVWAILDPQAPAGVSSFGITRMVVYPSGLRVMRLDHGAGSLQDAVDIMPEVEEFARSCGADKMRIEGRRGWQKIFTEGWHEVSRVIEKEL
jgi:hypothetical protein